MPELTGEDNCCRNRRPYGIGGKSCRDDPYKVGSLRGSRGPEDAPCRLHKTRILLRTPAGDQKKLAIFCMFVRGSVQTSRRNGQIFRRAASGWVRPIARQVLMMSSIDWGSQSILVTGGTGSFGRQFVRRMLERYHPRRLVVFSRDELKQSEMKVEFPPDEDSSMRYFLGDVRDIDRLRRAFAGVDLVVHAAALKQVPATEADPFEAVLTNIIGTKNVLEAAIDCRVKRVIILSSDKAVNPVNLYGATKLVAEKLTVQANTYGIARGTMLACCRYGNVIGSRGSVVQIFKEQRKAGRITITDERMTRFWMTLDQGVEFVVRSTERMCGGEVFVPKIPAMKVADLAKAVAPGCAVEKIGIRPGEKLHEILIGEDESRSVTEFDDYFIIDPVYRPWGEVPARPGGRPMPDRFTYTSLNTPLKLTERQLLKAIEEV